MSGIEVVGLVLGILPLAAKALQSYLGFVSSVRKVDSDLHNLLQDLKVEDTRLRNSCRQLLNDIIPFDSIEDGVGANPFSPELSLTVRNKLRLKLYDSYPIFEQTMTDMQAVAADLRLKLALQENGTAALKDKKSIIRQLKAKTGFTLRKKDYDATMVRLKSANTFLETLTSAGTGQHTKNKRRSDYRVISLLRKLVKSLFNALQNAATDCRCPVSHNACLELVARDLVFIHDIDIEELVAKDIDFHVTLSSGGSDLTQERLQLWPRWTSFRFQCGDPGAPPPPAIPPKSTTASPCPLVKSQTFNDELEALSPAVKWATELRSSKISGQSKKRPKRVSFAPVSQNATHALTEVSMASLAGLSLSGKPERQTTDTDVELTSMLKICQLSTHNKGKKRALGQDDLSHGCIMDAAGPRTFRLYPPRWKSGGQFRTHPDNSEFTTSFTLRQLLDQDLQGPTGGLFRLGGLLMKLRISHAIAARLLYIYDTPWLSQILTLDSIVFFLDDNSHIQLDQLQPFVLRSMGSRTGNSSHRGSDIITTHQAPPLGYPVSGSRPLDAIPFSLALILIQLMLECVDDRIDLAKICAPTPSGENVLRFSTIKDLHTYTDSFLGKLTEGCSINFENAVRWCLDRYKGTSGFFYESFCHEFRTEVVDVLEQEVNVLEKWEKVQSF